MGSPEVTGDVGAVVEAVIELLEEEQLLDELEQMVLARCCSVK